MRSGSRKNPSPCFAHVLQRDRASHTCFFLQKKVPKMFPQGSQETSSREPVPTCSSRTKTWPSKLKGLSLVATQAPAMLQVAM